MAPEEFLVRAIAEPHPVHAVEVEPGRDLRGRAGSNSSRRDGDKLRERPDNAHHLWLCQLDGGIERAPQFRERLSKRDEVLVADERHEHSGEGVVHRFLGNGAPNFQPTRGTDCFA